MEQKKHPEQNQEQLPFSEQLRQSIINQPYDLAVLWGRAADSFPQNKRKQRTRTTIAVVVGVIIGILIFKEPTSFWRLFFVFTIIASVIGLKIVH